jgi:heterotetrameric sarcosine oxidase gamma subunit
VADLPRAHSAITGIHFSEINPDQAGVLLRDQSEWAKVLVQHNRDDAATPVSVGFGSVTSPAPEVHIVGWAPDQTLVLGSSSEDAADVVTIAFKRAPVTTVDLSHGFTMFSIRGESAIDALAKVCAVDLSERTPARTVVRTSVAKVAAGVIKLHSDPPEFLILCDRSFGRYLFEEMLVAAAEFGPAVEEAVAG